MKYYKYVCDRCREAVEQKQEKYPEGWYKITAEEINTSQYEPPDVCFFICLSCLKELNIKPGMTARKQIQDAPSLLFDLIAEIAQEAVQQR